MLRANRHFVWTILLILALFANLLNVQVALADDGTPPPPPTEEPVQPPVEPAATETPLEEESAAPATTDAPVIEEVLADIPEDTDIVVLDEFGNPVPLVSQEAAEIILATDPMWCPVVSGVPTLPGGAGCSSNFATPQDLLNNMDDSNPATTTSMYESDGIIYFTANPGGALSLIPGSGNSIDNADYNVLKAFSLTLQGGWDGNTISPTISGQTSFAANSIRIGTSSNPWTGNITLNDITFSGTSSTAVLIVTSSGDITLDNVDVSNHTSTNAASLTSTSGDIIIQNNSVFDGDNTNANGVTATTASGAITISDSTFQQFKRSGTNSTWDGLTLSAPTLTLNNVTSTDNDGDGISITNANIVTLNSVISSSNGTELGAAGLTSNDGSGVVISGLAGSNVYVFGGTFNNNQEYGVEIATPANTTLNIWTAPTCTGNDSNSPPTSNCYNVTTVVDLEPPVISFVSRTPPANVNGWNNSSVTVTWSCTDSLSGVVSSTVTQTLSSQGANQSVTGTCEDLSGNTASDTQTGISIDFTDPTLNLPGNLTAEATGPSGANVNYSVTASDNLDNSPIVACSPASGSTFAIGTTTVNCSAMDNADNSSTDSFSITVADTTAPTLTLPANITEQITSPAGNVVTFSASASDLVDGARPVTFVPPSGSLFPAGTTTVNCSATDTRGNTATGAFTITIQDTTAPSISAMPDIFTTTRNASKVVHFSSPTTYDVVDGPGVASCTPPSGSNFPVGVTTVNCTATDNQGNSASVNFTVTVIYTRVPTTTVFSGGSGGGIILVTGGELIDLDCTSSMNAFGVLVKFHSLCDHQAVLNQITEDALPAALPAGYSFVQGIDLEVLGDGQALNVLPENAGVEFHYPLPGATEFAVLFWNGTAWVEITQAMNASNLANLLSTDAGSGLFKMSSSNASSLNVLTTEMTGTFVLVAK